MTHSALQAKSSFWNDRLPFAISWANELSFTLCTRSHRQRKLNGHAGARSARGPYPSPVSFDDRTADRQPHAHAAGLGRVEWVEEAVKTLRAQFRAGILHG